MRDKAERIIWVLVNDQGEYLQVDINFQTGVATRWFDAHRAMTPCFDRACEAWRYAAQFVPAEFQPVHPTPEVL